MSAHDDPRNPPKTDRTAGQDARNARLSEALKANLRRRKAQARNRREADDGDARTGSGEE